MKLAPRTLATLFRLALPIVMAGCAGSKVVNGNITATDRLFPDGNYRHEVTLTIPPHDGVPEKHYSFDGVVQLKPDAIRVVMLSPLGTTAAKIVETLPGGQLQVDIYIDSMKKFEPRIREYYSVLRGVLLAGKTQQTPGFAVESRDTNQIPSEFSIQDPRFKVQVKVTGYEM